MTLTDYLNNINNLNLEIKKLESISGNTKLISDMKYQIDINHNKIVEIIAQSEEPININDSIFQLSGEYPYYSITLNET